VKKDIRSFNDENAAPLSLKSADAEIGRKQTLKSVTISKIGMAGFRPLVASNFGRLNIEY
jgi:hypothetical protein